VPKRTLIRQVLPVVKDLANQGDGELPPPPAPADHQENVAWSVVWALM
jgi:hypothetical protein